MTIYIAVCDDNAADRKQLERLLSREKDKRLEDNCDVLYIDSFGNKESLMHTPVKYDIFMIDITDSAENGMDIAKELRKNGIIAPIVLCSSSIDYSAYVNAPNDLIFIEKPISAGQVSHLIDVAGEWTKSKVPLLEIRCQKETRFIKYTELIKAEPKAKFLTEVTLSDGSYLKVTESFKKFASLCDVYNSFIKCGRYLVNIEHIRKASKDSFTLSNGDTVQYNFFQKDQIIRVLGEYIGKKLS